MQCKALPVVQKEQGSVWLYALERARGVPVMDGADAEFVADAVFGAHEFRSRQMCKFVGLLSGIEALDDCSSVFEFSLLIIHIVR